MDKVSSRHTEKDQEMPVDLGVGTLEARDADKGPETGLPIARPRLPKTEVRLGFCERTRAALNGWRIYIARGKTLGGSSVNPCHT
jgi:hypothetical protein